MWVIKVFSGDRRKPIVDKTAAISSRSASASARVPEYDQAPVVRVPDQPVVGQTLSTAFGPLVGAGCGPARGLGNVLVQDREGHVAQQRG